MILICLYHTSLILLLKVSAVAQIYTSLMFKNKAWATAVALIVSPKNNFHLSKITSKSLFMCQYVGKNKLK